GNRFSKPAPYQARQPRLASGTSPSGYLNSAFAQKGAMNSPKASLEALQWILDFRYGATIMRKISPARSFNSLMIPDT
ncbi:MAG: hypothetical protein ACP5OU_02445, partial [Methanothrix sp.]